MGGVTMGDNVVVCANSLVISDVPSGLHRDGCPGTNHFTRSYQSLPEDSVCRPLNDSATTTAT